MVGTRRFAHPTKFSSAPSESRYARSRERCAASGARASLLARRAHVDLALDKSPFFGRAEHDDQFLEQRGLFRRVFEPGEKIKGLAEIAAVIELPRDRGQIFQRAGDVVRFCLKDLAPFFLRQLPPGGGFPD